MSAPTPDRARNTAELWCVDLLTAVPGLLAIEARTPRLSDEDRARASSFSDRTVREEWVATHIALRLLIERAAGARWRGVAYARSDRGKPHLEGIPLAFSLSHAPGLALIGIASQGSIGVDVERARPVRVGAARRTRIEEAGAALTDRPLPSEGSGRFLQAWVRLEAYAKADGCGLGRLLTQLGILGAGAVALDEREGVAAIVHRMSSDPQSPRLVIEPGLGEGVFAAVAASGAIVPGEPSWLPTSAEGLEKLLA